jgi:hypothetical protein
VSSFNFSGSAIEWESLSRISFIQPATFFRHKILKRPVEAMASWLHHGEVRDNLKLIDSWRGCGGDEAGVVDLQRSRRIRIRQSASSGFFWPEGAFLCALHNRAPPSRNFLFVGMIKNATSGILLTRTHHHIHLYFSGSSYRSALLERHFWISPLFSWLAIKPARSDHFLEIIELFNKPGVHLAFLGYWLCGLSDGFFKQEGVKMKRISQCLCGFMMIILPQLAWASAEAGYKGIASLYYGVIAVILIYGVYDIFGKNVVKYVGPLIAIGAYFMIPDV